MVISRLEILDHYIERVLAGGQSVSKTDDLPEKLGSRPKLQQLLKIYISVILILEQSCHFRKNQEKWI